MFEKYKEKREEKKKEDILNKAVKNNNIDAYAEEFKKQYPKNEDSDMIFRFMCAYGRKVGVPVSYGDYHVLSKMPKSLLMDMIMNYDCEGISKNIFMHLDDEHKKIFFDSIVATNDFENKIKYVFRYPMAREFITKDFINKLEEYDRKNNGNHLLTLLKYTFPIHEDVRKYVLNDLIKWNGKEIIVDIINNYKGEEDILYFIKDYVITPRPIDYKEMDNDYNNLNYYYNENLESRICADYIATYKIIDAYSNKHKKVEANQKYYELLLEPIINNANDRFLLTYYYLRNYRILPLPHKRLNPNEFLKTICSICSLKNKEDFRRFLEYYVEEIKSLNMVVDIKPILEYRYDLYNMEGLDLNKLYEIGNITDVNTVVEENINKLKKAVSSPDYKDESKKLKRSNYLIYLEMLFKNTLKLVTSQEDVYEMYHYIKDLSDILRLSNNFFNDDLNILYIAKESLCLDENVSKEVVNYILGDGNEVDYNRINRLKNSIKKIKYLKDESLVKLTTELLRTKDYDLIFSFLDSISKNNKTDIEVLRYAILNSNDKNVIAEYIYLAADEDLIKKKFIDKDNYIKYCDDMYIRREYEIKRRFKSE